MGLKPGMVSGYPRRPGLHRLLHQRPHRRSLARPPACVERTWWRRAIEALGLYPVPASSRNRLRRGTRRNFPSSRVSNGATPAGLLCLGTNGETVAAGKRCASTSNRNFVGRQGRGARTHLVSPAMAAAAALDRADDRRPPTQSGRIVREAFQDTSSHCRPLSRESSYRRYRSDEYPEDSFQSPRRGGFGHISLSRPAF